MARKIKVTAEGFGDAVLDILSEYADDVTEESKTLVQKTAEDAARAVRSGAQANFNGTKYKNSIQVKVKKKRLYSEAVVYSPKHYQLTHLLENGHRLVFFGHPTNTFIEGRAHWAPAEEEAVRALEEGIKEAAQK